MDEDQVNRYLRPEHNKKPASAEERELRYSRKWLRFRYEALRRSEGKCQLCGRTAKHGANLQVDHIKPRSKYPELTFVLSNLQVLCEECNYGKGASDDTDWQKGS